MVMVIGEILGAKETVLALGRKAGSIGGELRREVGVLAIKLVRHIKEDKLTGQVLKVKTGLLRRSITYKTSFSDTMIYALVGTNTVYAAIHEFGGKTKPHEIKAKNGKCLAFIMGSGPKMFGQHLGKQSTVLVQSVMHPGSKMPMRSFLRSALTDMHDEIVSGLQAAANKGAAK